MAEVLVTYEQAPPFATDRIIGPQEKLELLGPGSLERVILEASPEVVATAVAELDRTPEEGANPALPAFRNLQELGTDLSENAEYDSDVRDALIVATPTEARRLGALAAASAVVSWITRMRDSQPDSVNVMLDAKAEKLKFSQAEYEPGSREQVLREAHEVAGDPKKREERTASIVLEVAAEAAGKSLSEAAADFRAFVVHAPAKAEIECQHYPQAFSYPPTYEEALAQAPEFATKVIEAVNISSGDTELSPLKHYGVGVGRAIGFISLVTAKIASGESSTSI